VLIRVDYVEYHPRYDCNIKLNKFYIFTKLRPTLKLLKFMLREGKTKKYTLILHQIICVLYENFLFELSSDFLTQNYKFYIELREYLFTNHKFYNLNILINWYVLSLLPMFDVSVTKKKKLKVADANNKLVQKNVSNLKYKYIFRNKRYALSLKWIVNEIQSRNLRKLYDKFLTIFFDNILNFNLSFLHKRKIYIYKRLLAKKKLLQ